MLSSLKMMTDFTLPGPLISGHDSSLSQRIPGGSSLFLPEPLYGAAVSASLTQDEKVV